MRVFGVYDRDAHFAALQKSLPLVDRERVVRLRPLIPVDGDEDEEQLRREATAAIEDARIGDVLVLIATRGLHPEFEARATGDTALTRAAWAGNVEAVYALHSLGCDVNYVTSTGTTALAEACKAQHQGVVSALTDCGADVNAETAFGETPLTQLINGLEAAVVATARPRALRDDAPRAMIAFGDLFAPLAPLLPGHGGSSSEEEEEEADEEAGEVADDGGSSRAGGPWESVEQRRARLEDEASAQAVAAALYGASRGRRAAVDHSRAPAGPGAASGTTAAQLQALRHATAAFQRRVAARLAVADLDPYSAASRGTGRAQRRAARRRRRVTLAEALETAQRLLHEGAAVNAETRTGETALLRAAALGALPLVQLLLANGAAPDHRNRAGITALHKAIGSASTDVVATLLQRGADPSLRTRRGVTPLLLASLFGHARIAAALLAMPGPRRDIDYESADGRTALAAAAAGGHVEIVKLLVRHRATVDLETLHGATALGHACAANQPEAARVLLDAGADADYASLLAPNLDTPRQIAARPGHEAVRDAISAWAHARQRQRAAGWALRRNRSLALAPAESPPQRTAPRGKGLRAVPSVHWGVRAPAPVGADPLEVAAEGFVGLDDTDSEEEEAERVQRQRRADRRRRRRERSGRPGGRRREQTPVAEFDTVSKEPQPPTAVPLTDSHDPLDVRQAAERASTSALQAVLRDASGQQT